MLRTAFAGSTERWLARLGCPGAALAAALRLPAAPAGAQLFLASRSDPACTVGPLMIRTSVAETAGPVTVQVLWSLDVPSGARAGAAQDLHLLWPGEAQPGTAGPRPAGARSCTGAAGSRRLPGACSGGWPRWRAGRWSTGEVRVRLAGDVVEDLEAGTRCCRLGPDGARGRTQ